MNEFSPRRAIIEELANVAKALGNSHRLDLLQYIAQGERSVERLAELTHLSVANASQHLQSLRRSDLVKTRREGKNIYYRLASPNVVALLNALSAVAEESNAQVQVILSDYFNNLDSLEPLSREELARRIEEENVTILDVRPEDEYSMGHVPGALSVPTPQLDERLRNLPKDQPIVAYCRGTYCVASFEMVAKLREMGYDVRRMEQGFPEWKAAGLTYETGSGDGSETEADTEQK